MKRIISRFKEWLRRFILGHEYFISVDYGIVGDTEILVLKHDLKSGKLEVISNYRTETKTMREIDKCVRELCKKFQPIHVTKDIPFLP